MVGVASDHHAVDFPELTGGRRVWVYAQTEVVKDLAAGGASADSPLLAGRDEMVRGLPPAFAEDLVVLRDPAEWSLVGRRDRAASHSFRNRAR